MRGCDGMFADNQAIFVWAHTFRICSDMYAVTCMSGYMQDVD